MIADLPAKRHRQAAGHAPQQVLRPKRKLDKQRKKVIVKRHTSKDAKTRKVQPNNDTNDISVIDEDDQPLKPKTKIYPEKTAPAKKRFSSRVVASRNKKVSSAVKENPTLNEYQQNSPNDNENASQPQKMSSEDSTQRLNISGNDNKGEGENRDGADNNGNGNEREKPSGEDRDKDIGRGADPDPTLLKHSINNITASTSNKALHLKQQYPLPQQSNVAETSQDNRHFFLENELGSLIPDKPPLQTNQNNSSLKKRQSLLNCIEKIKSQQKGETMVDHTMMMKQDRRAIENAHWPLLDPHPAVICSTRDESGAAKNVVPDNIGGPQVHVADELYQTEKDRNYRCCSEIVSEHKLNETLVWAPIVEPMYLQEKSSDPEFASPRAEVPSGEPRRKLSATRSSMAQNDYELSQLRYPQIIQPPEWGMMHLDPVSYVRMIQPQLQKHMLQSQKKPFSENVTPQLQCSEPFKSDSTVNYQCQSFSVSAQCNASDMHYDGRRDRVPRRNETASQFICEPHQNPNISSLSPQSWNRECTQIQQAYKNHAMPSMLPSINPNELVVPTVRRTPQRRISEASELDMLGNCRSLGDTNMLNYGYLRRSSSETTANIYEPPTSQENRESSHYYNTLKRPNVQKDASYNKSLDFTSFTQDEYGRTYDYMGAVSDSMTKSAENYQTAQSYSVTVANNANFVIPIAVKEHQSGNSIDDSHLVSYKDLVPKRLYSSKLNKKKNHEHYLAENLHLHSTSTLVPTETQIAKITPSPSDSTILKSPITDTRDLNNDNIQINLPVSANKVLSTKKHKPCGEVRDHQDSSEDQSDSGLTDEPLDLSAKKVPATGSNEPRTHSVLSAKLKDRKQKNVLDFEDIDHHKNNEDVPANLFFKDRLIDNITNDKYIQEQHGPCIIEQNNAGEKPTQSGCKISTVAFNKETNEFKTLSHGPMDENSYMNKLPNTLTEQSSYEIETDNNKYLNESFFISNDSDVEDSKTKKVIQSKSDSQSGAPSSSNSSTSNYCLTANIITDRLDKINEKFASAWENQRLFETTKANTFDTVQSNNSTYHANTDGTENANYNSPTNIQQSTYHIRGDKEQIQMQNQVFESNNEKTACLAVDKTDVNHTNTNTTTPPIDQDPETAKKIAMFPKELVDLLGAVPKEQHSKLVNVISQLIPAVNHEAVKPLITVQTSQSVTQHVEEPSTKAYTPPICDTPTNYTVNRLTINTAVLPSSSILPKKRHSPSARLNSQDAYSTMILSKPSPIPAEQPSSTMIFHNDIPDSNQFFSMNKHNEKSSCPMTDIIKKISEVNECKPKKCTDETVKLTDNDFDHSKTMPKTLNLNVLPIQEPVPKLQVTSKNSNEKTASLRAVRIKTPLARKSISDEKLPVVTKDFYSQQSTYLDLRQKDLKATQISHSECGNTHSTAAQNAEYLDNIPKDEAETRTATEKFALIRSETSNLTSMAACDPIEQLEIGAVSNVAPEKVQMLNRTFNSVNKHLPSVNQIEQKNIAMPYKENKCSNNKEALPPKTIGTEIIAEKNTEYDILLGSIQSDAAHDSSQYEYTNMYIPVSDKQEASTLDSSFLILPEQINNSVGNPSLDTENTKVSDIDSHVNDIQQIIKSNETSDTITSLTYDMAPQSKFSEDEDSDDDISLAVIVKQKQKEQTNTFIKDACASVINKSNMEKQTSNENASKNLIQSSGLELFAINSTLNCIDREEKSIREELKIDESRKNSENKQHTMKTDETADEALENLTAGLSNGEDIYKIKQDEETNDFDINVEKETFENSSNKEHDIIIVSEITSVENAKQTYVPFAPTDENIKDLAQINTNNTDIHSEVNEPIYKNKSHDLWNKDASSGEIVSNPKTKRKIEDLEKCMHATMESFVQNIETQAEKNEFQTSSYISQKASLNQSMIADEVNVSLIDDKTNNSKIQNSPIILQSLSGDSDIVSANRQRSKKLKKYATVESALVTDSELSTDFKETSKRALRRSNRGKSMFLDDTSSIDHDTVSAIEIKKVPVTKKQLIFSKLLQDEREKITNLISSVPESDVTFASAIETKKYGSTKRKNSPGKTKNKKKKTCNLKHEDVSDSLNATADDNNKNIIEKELSCPDSLDKTESLDSGAIENERIFEFNDDNSDILTVSNEKRKLNISLLNDASYDSKAKRIKINNSNDNTFEFSNESKTYECTIQTNTDTGSHTEASVKTNDYENTIESNHVTNTTDYNDSKNQPGKTNTYVEIRTACYNRPIVGKKICSTSVPVKNPKNYDPYDIDMDLDIEEPELLIEKQKSNKTVSSHNTSKTSKKKTSYERSVHKVLQEPAIEKHVLAVSNTTPHNNISDSDSSISDVPLQKYVEEKEKLKIEILQPSICNNPENDTEPNSESKDSSESHNIDFCGLASQSLKKSVIDNNDKHYESNVIKNNTALVLITTDDIDKTNKTGIKDITSDRKDNITDKINIIPQQNVDQIENDNKTSTAKSNKKKNRRSITCYKKVSLNVSNETDQQLSSDKYMENFGFYSVRKPRKSNLLASKKISETFHMIENDDAYFRSKDRPRKSSHTENKKTTDAVHTSKTTQGSFNVCFKI